jgi:polyhydroxyalkanoate synthesis regulator phasin
MDEQIKQQDVWNNHMQQQMEAIMEHYQRIDALEEKVAALQAKLDVVCGNKEGANEGRRSGGRRC